MATDSSCSPIMEAVSEGVSFCYEIDSSYLHFSLQINASPQPQRHTPIWLPLWRRTKSCRTLATAALRSSRSSIISVLCCGVICPFWVNMLPAMDLPLLPQLLPLLPPPLLLLQLQSYMPSACWSSVRACTNLRVPRRCCCHRTLASARCHHRRPVRIRISLTTMRRCRHHRWSHANRWSCQQRQSLRALLIVAPQWWRCMPQHRVRQCTATVTRDVVVTMWLQCVTSPMSCLRPRHRHINRPALPKHCCPDHRCRQWCHHIVPAVTRRIQ